MQDFRNFFECAYDFDSIDEFYSPARLIVDGAQNLEAPFWMIVDFPDKARRPPTRANDQESSLIEALPAHGMHDKIDNRFFRKDKNKTRYGEDYEKHPAHKVQLEKKDEHAESQISEKR
jgi:hypothetical protein